MNIGSQMAYNIDRILAEFNPKICSFAYNLTNGKPVVCQMGYATYLDKIILHTNTWTNKWKYIYNGQNVALCIGFNYLQNYVQIQGVVKKIYTKDDEFSEMEKKYFQDHPDAIKYKDNNQEGIILITPLLFRYAKVIEHNVTFDDYYC